jgi:hypothetical protein
MKSPRIIMSKHVLLIDKSAEIIIKTAVSVCRKEASCQNQTSYN